MSMDPVLSKLGEHEMVHAPHVVMRFGRPFSRFICKDVEKESDTEQLKLPWSVQLGLGRFGAGDIPRHADRGGRLQLVNAAAIAEEVDRCSCSWPPRFKDELLMRDTTSASLAQVSAHSGISHESAE